MNLDPAVDPSGSGEEKVDPGQEVDPQQKVVAVTFRTKDPFVPPAPRQRAPWTHTFQHRGRTYSLYKRQLDQEGAYYIRLMHRGKIHKKSLEVNSIEASVARAKNFIDQVLGEKWAALEAIKARRTVSTIADLLEVYRKIARVQPVTLKNNQDAIRWIFKTATGSFDPAKLRLTEFSASLVSRFQTAMRDRAAAAAPQSEDALREAKDRALRTSRSVIRQARSIFNHRYRMLDQYDAAGLSLPIKSIQEFMKARVEGRDRKPEYFPPSDDVVQKAFAAIEEQKRQPRIYIAFWLAVGAGLRRGEIARMRWEYIVDRQGKAWISGSLGKDGEKIETPMQERAVAALAPFRQASGKCIDQTSLDWARRLNNWMESQGWATEKKMHELRAYTGSLIYQTDPVSAMMFLRHKSIRQTEQFYVRYSKGFKSVQVL